jgi:hypothetical protein
MKKITALLLAVLMLACALTSCGERPSEVSTPEEVKTFEEVFTSQESVYIYKTADALDSVAAKPWWHRVEVLRIEGYAIPEVRSECYDTATGAVHTASEVCNNPGHRDCSIYVQAGEDGLILFYINTPSAAWYMVAPLERVTYRLSELSCL